MALTSDFIPPDRESFWDALEQLTPSGMYHLPVEDR